MNSDSYGSQEGQALRERLDAAFEDASLQKDERRIAALRLACVALKDREVKARGAGQDGLSEDDMLEVLQVIIAEHCKSALQYEEDYQLDLAQQEREIIEVLSTYLPPKMNDEEMIDICHAVISELNAMGLRDIGRTMDALKEKYGREIDTGAAHNIIKKILMSQ